MLGDCLSSSSAARRRNPRGGAGIESQCYDLVYQQGSTTYNVLLFQLTAAGHLKIRYDPTPRAASGCAAALLAEPAEWTAEYVR